MEKSHPVPLDCYAETTSTSKVKTNRDNHKREKNAKNRELKYELIYVLNRDERCNIKYMMRFKFISF